MCGVCCIAATCVQFLSWREQDRLGLQVRADACSSLAVQQLKPEQSASRSTIIASLDQLQRSEADHFNHEHSVLAVAPLANNVAHRPPAKGTVNSPDDTPQLFTRRQTSLSRGRAQLNLTGASTWPSAIYNNNNGKRQTIHPC